MIQLVWPTHRISRVALLVVAVVAVLGLAAVEAWQITSQSPDFDQRIRAARMAAMANRTLREERLERNLPIDSAVDPSQTGLIGSLSSPVTSGSATLASKRLGTDPNLAALIYKLLTDAGVRPEDPVAVAVTGSYPGANVAAYAALSALDAQPVIISSPAATEWGANLIGFAWPDMEAALYRRGHFQLRSTAGSLAGLEDRGESMSRVGRSMMRSMFESAAVPMLEAEGPAAEIERRIAVYDSAIVDRRPAAYLVVGGDAPVLGGADRRDGLKPGVNTPSALATTSAVGGSVPAAYLRRGVPVILVDDLPALASRYGLITEEGEAYPLGEGSVYATRQRSHGLILLVFAAIVGTLIVVSIRDPSTWPRLPDPAVEEEPEDSTI